MSHSAMTHSAVGSAALPVATATTTSTSTTVTTTVTATVTTAPQPQPPIVMPVETLNDHPMWSDFLEQLSGFKVRGRNGRLRFFILKMTFWVNFGI